MTEKVKVLREVAKAIEEAFANAMSHKAILMAHESTGKWTEEFSALNTLDFDTLARAIYIGFEVEETPQEKLAEYYNHQKQVEEDYMDMLIKGQAVARVEAVDYVLETLNIKVEGVNA